MDSELDKRLIKSYVWHDGKCFYVSTIDRNSSSIHGGRFAETIVWEFDWAKRERGEQIGMTGGASGSITKHNLICMMLSVDGVFGHDI